MQHVYATQQLIYALTHAQDRMQTHSHLSVQQLSLKSRYFG